MASDTEWRHLPSGYPARYTESRCCSNEGAVQVCINVGEMSFGRAPVWHRPSKRELDGAGLPPDDVKVARSACQFPVEKS